MTRLKIMIATKPSLLVLIDGVPQLGMYLEQNYAA